MSSIQTSSSKSLARIASMGLGLPWFEIAGELWHFGRKVMRGLSSEGMYEVLDYQSTLELHDPGGKKATFTKRKKVRYLQDNIVAYQDHAWGDGEILLDYRSNPGVAVDRYRCGHKTLVLLSLREMKSRGDEDEFRIRWNIRNGFLAANGFWATDVTNRTRRLKVRVIFPRSRPPRRLTLVEANRKRTHILGRDAIRSRPDGRWGISWEKKKPMLFEDYVLNWEW
jgi:hypothetical protein